MAVRSVVVLNDFCHVQGGASRVAIDEAVALQVGRDGRDIPRRGRSDRTRTVRRQRQDDLSATAATARRQPTSENVAAGVVEPPCLPSNTVATGSARPTADHRSSARLHQGADDHARAGGAPGRLCRHLHAARLLRRLPERRLLRLPAATALPSARVVTGLHADQLRQAASGPQGLSHRARRGAAPRGALSRIGTRLHRAVASSRCGCSGRTCRPMRGFMACPTSSTSNVVRRSMPAPTVNSWWSGGSMRRRV